MYSNRETACWSILTLFFFKLSICIQSTSFCSEVSSWALESEPNIHNLSDSEYMNWPTQFAITLTINVQIEKGKQWSNDSMSQSSHYQGKKPYFLIIYNIYYNYDYA